EAGIRLGASERNQLLNALSWYDENAAKVIRKVEKFDRGQLAALLQRLGCSEAELPDFGYYPHGKPGEFITFEPSSDLRDSESIPLADSIHQPLRSMEEVAREIVALERRAEGLIAAV
ncbi:SAM-dependent DNA methyltransferase, partial [Pseudomonas aeruginosa]